jgi:hypothetical protein
MRRAHRECTNSTEGSIVERMFLRGSISDRLAARAKLHTFPAEKAAMRTNLIHNIEDSSNFPARDAEAGYCEADPKQPHDDSANCPPEGSDGCPNQSEYCPPNNTADDCPPNNTDDDCPPNNTDDDCPPNNTDDDCLLNNTDDCPPNYCDDEDCPPYTDSDACPPNYTADECPPSEGCI